MSIREQIVFLEELASIDLEIGRIEEQLQSQRGDLDGMRTELQAVDERLVSDRARLAEMDKTRNELMIELRQMSQQVERSREKLNRSRNERESNAAQREVEELRKLYRDREDEIEKINTLSEAARASIEAGETKLAEITAALEGTREGAAKNLSELDAELTSRNDARAIASKKLPAIIYRRYESIRTRRPFAIAKTHDGTCLGCHISVPPMMFNKMLRQEEFEQCPNCRRILYYTPAPTAGTDASGASEQTGA